MYTKDKTGVVMVGRAMEILDYLAGKDKPVGISEMAKDLSLPKATVFRLLNSLEEWNAVECSENEGYQLGCFLIKLGRSASKDLHLIDICKPYMDRIMKEVDENVNLAIEYENAMLSIYSTYSNSSVLSIKTIPISPMYCSAIGKAALAYYDDEKLAAYFKRQDLRKRTAKTIITREAFEKERERIRESGLAYDDEEYEEGLFCMATPLFNAEGAVVACISVSGGYGRMMAKKEKVAEVLRQAKEFIEIYTESMDRFEL